MTKILTALTFAIALGLSMASVSAESGGSFEDPAYPLENVSR